MRYGVDNVTVVGNFMPPTHPRVLGMQDKVGPWAGEASSGTYFHLSVGCLIVLLAIAALQNRAELKLWLRRQRWARRS
jgi:hypothetical protein